MDVLRWNETVNFNDQLRIYQYIYINELVMRNFPWSRFEVQHSGQNN